MIDVEVTVHRVPDDDPDLSWLDQTDAVMGEGFERHANARKASYGDAWTMVGIYASAAITAVGVVTTVDGPGLWGIESDSDDDYFADVSRDVVSELRKQLHVLTRISAEAIDKACADAVLTAA